MKRKYYISGIGCGGCIARIKKTLEAHPAIEETKVYLNPKGATVIRMKEKLSIDELQKQLNSIEGFTIEKMN
ncbi:heavy-metal-associated domain-containing protein [Gramella sp. AN32]|uniref:Heavy-metal-associated domain-containing protein n=1 Tax=Christiangramia antarctica TaxID=2058158 RepID=A0ABW5X6H2_9FLAO|nr:heavy-metal-associated domain-containing protein [Gramella sp. AN32]MCM4154395.1 copper resistance protein CopZ [Gramella sp. AN32]